MHAKTHLRVFVSAKAAEAQNGHREVAGHRLKPEITEKRAHKWPDSEGG